MVARRRLPRRPLRLPSYRRRPPVIGAAGGTVTETSGAQVVVPAGALASNSTIRIAMDSTGAPPMPGGSHDRRQHLCDHAARRRLRATRHRQHSRPRRDAAAESAAQAREGAAQRRMGNPRDGARRRQAQGVGRELLVLHRRHRHLPRCRSRSPCPSTTPSRSPAAARTATPWSVRRPSASRWSATAGSFPRTAPAGDVDYSEWLGQHDYPVRPHPFVRISR